METLSKFKFERELLNKYYIPENFFNRDLSWLEFNRRVMDEAFIKDLPLLDKIKFVAIFFLNLDEYYMIRVAGIKDQIAAKIVEPTIDGLTPRQELAKIEIEVNEMLDKVYSYWNNTLMKDLKKNDIRITEFSKLENDEKIALKQYFIKEISPVLTPLAFDPGRPFPYISNLSLSFALIVKKTNGDKHFARLKIPGILPRLIHINKIVDDYNNSKSDGPAKFVWLDDLIKEHLFVLFPGLEVLQAHQFRITRDSDIEIQEDEADDLLELIEENIRQRRFGNVVRLEVEKEMPESMIGIITENLLISTEDIHIIDGPLGLSSVMELTKLQHHTLKEKPFLPHLPTVFEDDEKSIFSIIKESDRFLHHPYNSFKPVEDFIKQAAHDPDVLAIKQTLYRTGSDSPVIKYLIEAAEAKKQVAVLVELKARFDEENNIIWAKELEKAGIHVVYGLVGLKTHCKMAMVVRKEADGVKRYVHLGTGNYNASTAKLYTDMGLLTNDPEICADVSEVFNYLTGYSEQKRFRKLFVAPVNIRTNILQLIAREIDHCRKGKKGHLIFKMNSLVDPALIAALYEASKFGVKVELIVRGICCLVPQKPGLSDNIRVISIVGRFLEHSRIYFFNNGGDYKIYLSSADLMPRNLDRRVETAFPVKNAEIKKYIKEHVLEMSMKDNQKARVLLPNGRYVQNYPVYTDEVLNLQEYLMQKFTPSDNTIS